MKTKRENKTSYSTVSLPAPLVEKIKETINGTGYVSVSDFVTDIIRTVLMLEEIQGKIESLDSKLEQLRGFL